MSIMLPQVDTRSAYEKLATVYAVLFFATAGLFYWVLVVDGYDAGLALLAAAVAALHFSLIRLVRSSTLQSRAFRPQEQTVVPRGTDIAGYIHSIRQAAQRNEEVGLMLVYLATEADAPTPADIERRVRAEMAGRSESPVFDLEDGTLAVVQRDEDVSLRLVGLASAVHRQVQAAQPHRGGPATRALVGAAIGGEGRWRAEQLIESGRAAIRLAQTNGRDTFFRRV